MRHESSVRLFAKAGWMLVFLFLCGVPGLMASERVVLGEYFTNQY